MNSIEIIETFCMVFASILSIPLFALATLCVASLVPGRRSTDFDPARPRCAVLVPAHNEELGIARTVASLTPQLLSGDRLVVIADNCSDRTAEIARSLGAEVLERRDDRRRGKGFALDFGIRALASNAPAVVVIVDADCTVNDTFIARLVSQVHSTGRPAQSCNLVTLPGRAALRDRLSWFAFVVKNLVRPLGLSRFGMPCLTSTGNAFPWSVLENATLASDNLVEDMQLGLDAAIAGHAAAFCPDARVSSSMPVGAQAALGQRTRWEHGHLQTIVNQAPRLVKAAFRQRRFDLLVLALEVAIPPLSLHFLIVTFAFAASLALWLFAGIARPGLVLGAGAIAVGSALVGVWAKFARECLTLRQLLATPLYALWKVPIYLSFLACRQKTWVRTTRQEVTAAAFAESK